jgi:hypothetical protein
MASCVYSAHAIPGNYVAQALIDLKVAVRANPRLTVVGISANRGLGGVLDVSLYLGAPNSQSGNSQREVFGFFEPGL